MKFYDGLKILFMILCLTMTFTLDAQTKKRLKVKKPEFSLDMVGGFFLHGKMFDNSSNYFAGFKTMQFGYSKYYRHKKIGINADFNHHFTDYTSYNLKRFMLALQYYRLYNMFEKRGFRFLFGGFSGLLFDKERLEPIYLTVYPDERKQYGINVGPKFEFVQKVSNNLSIFIGSKIGIFEISYDKSIIHTNPILPRSVKYINMIDFTLTERFNVNFGVSIKM